MPVRLVSRFPEIAATLKPRTIVALEPIADRIVEGAKARVPVDTGKLQRAIHKEKVEGGWEVVAGDDDAWYGHLVEHGTNRVGPRPFLVPAAEEQRDDIAEVVAVSLRRL